MGRLREYDEKTVLAEAAEAFRRGGYRAVSVKNLEDATGLKGGSIYHNYDDKAGLFEQTLAHYNEKVIGGRIAKHAPEAAGLKGLRALFLSALDEPNGEFFGCLITNSAIEFGGGVDPMPTGIQQGLKILLDAFAVRVASSRSAKRGIKPANLAGKLLVLYQGILVLIRSGCDKAWLKKMINDEFDQLER